MTSVLYKVVITECKQLFWGGGGWTINSDTVKDGNSTAIFAETAHCHCKRFAVLFLKVLEF